VLTKTSKNFQVTALAARPQMFGDVVGQKHITVTLRHALQREEVAHAMLFSGPRGVGKTSTARILAKALNCTESKDGEPCNQCLSCTTITRGTSIDVLEIDAASHNGVDHIRDLREQVRYPPSGSKHKVYVIDEVHMLSTGAFNALLKTLEEPPSYVRFIMATTELHKVPATILSRCQKYRFRPISMSMMVDNLKGVIGEAGMARLLPEEAEQVLYYVARGAQGSLRDAQSTLDQVLALSGDKVSYRDVEELLGMVEQEALADLFDHLARRETSEMIMLLDKLLAEGKDPQQLVRDMQGYCRNLLIAHHHSEPASLLELPADLVKRLSGQARRFEVGSLLRIAEILWDLEARMRWSAESRMLLEVTMLKAARLSEAASLDRLLARLAELEAKMGGPLSPSDLPKPNLERIAGYQIASKPKSSSTPLAPTPSTQPPPTRNQKEVAHGEEQQPESSPPASESLEPDDEPEAEKAATPLLGDLNLDLIKARWNNVIQNIEEGRISGCLVDAVPSGLKGDCLTLDIPVGFKFHMDTLSSHEGVRLLESAIKKELRQTLRIAFEYAEKSEMHPSSAARAPDGEHPSGKPKKDRVEDLEPGVLKMLETFDGKIVKFNRDK
jgi:DNA polymerase III subunit gamma/tau